MCASPCSQVSWQDTQHPWVLMGAGVLPAWGSPPAAARLLRRGDRWRRREPQGDPARRRLPVWLRRGDVLPPAPTSLRSVTLWCGGDVGDTQSPAGPRRCTLGRPVGAACCWVGWEGSGWPGWRGDTPPGPQFGHYWDLPFPQRPGLGDEEAPWGGPGRAASQDGSGGARAGAGLPARAGGSGSLPRPGREPAGEMLRPKTPQTPWKMSLMGHQPGRDVPKRWAPTAQP